MTYKEKLSERYKRNISHPYWQRKIYRNKIALPIFFGLFLLLYPIELFISKLLNFDGYIGSTLVVIVSLSVAITIGEYKANKKFEGK